MKNAKKEYVNRINRVIDYINKNLSSEITLDSLARVSYFSKFHFSRIFKAVTEESLYGFIKRLRLERAAGMLKSNTEKSITDIAFDCGFNSSANFADAFKKHFKISASDYRKKSKNSKIKSNISKDKKEKSGYNSEYFKKNIQEVLKMKVEVKELPDYKVAYARHIGPYDSRFIGPLWKKLCAQAGARGLFGPQTIAIGASYDDPAITPADKCRYDACITVPDNAESWGDIGVMVIKGGKYAVYRFEDTVDKIGEAFGKLYGVWLPESGFEPDDRPCLEIYRKCDEDSENPFCSADICIPVKPLS